MDDSHQRDDFIRPNRSRTPAVLFLWGTLRVARCNNVPKLTILQYSHLGTAGALRAHGASSSLPRRAIAVLMGNAAMCAGAMYPDAILDWLAACPAQEQELRSQRLWEAISEELSALLGAQGVASLLGRCLCMCHGAFPWLRAPDGSSATTADWRQLTGRMAGQRPADVQTASRLLFVTLHDLLQVLIGASLTAGVLDAAWGACKQRRPSAPCL
ncbi:hypothetical protein [Massilia sp. Root351]|uniref:hypothetical protein n=1 Tax=Massilia sp. Root351 TaxID=1736522 RepID=UPI0012F66724|nr:hypothetical protein [Massilia sp. Root351]